MDQLDASTPSSAESVLAGLLCAAVAGCGTVVSGSADAAHGRRDAAVGYASDNQASRSPPAGPLP